jgi:putative ABC transport system permease protein
MFKNYLKIALRSLWRQKGYSLINLIGLTVSLTTCLLIFLYVQDELTFDDHWQDSERIYRLENRWTGPDYDYHWAATPGIFIFKIGEHYPEVESFVKVCPAEGIFVVNEESFSEKSGMYADSLFFDVFNFEFLYGSKETAFNDLYSIVLTESLARKYFGDENPVYKGLQYLNWEQFTVTAVIKDVPDNSHFHFDYLVNMDLMRTLWDGTDADRAQCFYSYIKTTDEAATDALREKVKKDSYEIFDVPEERQSPDHISETIIQPISDIHLKGHAEKEVEANGNIQDIYIFISVAIFLLVIACINYMNLATARAVRRGREIGIRKVAGAQRRQIIGQFLGESFMMTLLALLLSVAIAYLLLPYFNAFSGKALSMDIVGNLLLIKILLGLLVIGSLLSGMYPAFVMAGFLPVNVLKSNSLSGRSSRSTLILRRVLVITQFAVSVMMIISVLTIKRQLDFIENKDIGFDKENLLVIPLAGMTDEEYDVVLAELKTVPGIKSVGSIEYLPGERVPFCSVEIPELARMNPERHGDDNGQTWLRTQHVYLEGTFDALGLEMQSGRWFDDDLATDEDDAFILNEAAVASSGIQDPVGKELWYTWNMDPPKKGTIIGVVKDFHYANFKTKIEPLMIHMYNVTNMIIKFHPEATDEVITDIKGIWKESVPQLPFEYYFLDESFDKLHINDIKLGVITTYFAFLALIIACLGLFGLALYMIEQRSKEIAMRKILGSSVPNILLIIFKEFFWLNIIANAIVWYPAFYFMNRWLGNFEYHVDLSIWSFVITFMASFVIIIISVSYKTIRAANTNPVRYLRNE